MPRSFPFADPALNVGDISADASDALLVEARLDGVGGLGERGEVGSLVPGACCRASDGWDHGNGCVLAHRRANFRDKRRHGLAAVAEISAHLAQDIRKPERVRHVVGEVDVTVEIGARARARPAS